MKPQILTGLPDVANYLAEKFGATSDQLLHIVQAGVAARNSCTSNHPSGAPGTMCWIEATGELRNIFLQLGYEKNDTDNIPSVYHKDRKVKIAVCNSDEGTGLAQGHPQPVRSKGDGVKRAVFPNEGVFKEILETALNVNETVSAETFWYICIFCEDDVFRAEILCPILNEDGSFKDFHKRIILESDGHAGGGMPILQENPDDGPNFDVPVTRRQQASS
jgi:hypothetical protein